MKTSVLLLHVVDVRADVIRTAGRTTVALLGTRFAMDESFYAERVATHGIEVAVPGAEDRSTVNASLPQRGFTRAAVDFARS
jgi:aspartate racemase